MSKVLFLGEHCYPLLFVKKRKKNSTVQESESAEKSAQMQSKTHFILWILFYFQNDKCGLSLAKTRLNMSSLLDDPFMYAAKKDLLINFSIQQILSTY